MGKTDQVNETILLIRKFEIEAQEKALEMRSALAQQDRSNLGYVRGDVAERAERDLKPVLERDKRRLAYDLREVYEREHNESDLIKTKKVPQGTPLTEKTARLLVNKYGLEGAKKAARIIGYEEPKDDIFE